MILYVRRYAEKAALFIEETYWHDYEAFDINAFVIDFAPFHRKREYQMLLVQPLLVESESTKRPLHSMHDGELTEAHLPGWTVFRQTQDFREIVLSSFLQIRHRKKTTGCQGLVVGR